MKFFGPVRQKRRPVSDVRHFHKTLSNVSDIDRRHEFWCIGNHHVWGRYYSGSTQEHTTKNNCTTAPQSRNWSRTQTSSDAIVLALSFRAFWNPKQWWVWAVSSFSWAYLFATTTFARWLLIMPNIEASKNSRRFKAPKLHFSMANW